MKSESCYILECIPFFSIQNNENAILRYIMPRMLVFYLYADLSTVTLPQKPVPKSLFPMLSKIKSVNFTTNPCLIDVGSIK